MSDLSPKAQKALLEFYHGIKTLERLRLEADGDDRKLAKYTKVAAHGLRVTEEALSESKANQNDPFTDFGSNMTPPTGGYLH
jgi:hypothetical protein